MRRLVLAQPMPGVSQIAPCGAIQEFIKLSNLSYSPTAQFPHLDWLNFLPSKRLPFGRFQAPFRAHVGYHPQWPNLDTFRRLNFGMLGGSFLPPRNPLLLLWSCWGASLSSLEAAGKFPLLLLGSCWEAPAPPPGKLPGSPLRGQIWTPPGRSISAS